MFESGHGRDAVQQLLLSPDQTVTSHQHDEPQIVAPRTGVLAVTTDSGSWVVAAPESAIVIPAGVEHAHRAHAHSVVATILLAYPPAPSMTGDFPVLVRLTSLAQHLLVAMAEPGRPSRQRAALEQALRYELREDQQQCGTLSLPAPRDVRLRALTSALINRPGDRRGLADHARALGSSERTLRRLIRTELGMSFPQWRTLVRLVASLTHLANGESVNKTAHLCGFSSPSSFIARFREFLHATPGSYQERIRPSTVE